MTSSLFKPQTLIQAQAIYVGQSLNLKAFEGAPRLATSPLVVRAGSSGCAALFRYGAVVLFNMTPMEQVSFLADLKHITTDQLEAHESDIAQIMIDPEQPEKMEDKYIRIREGSIENIQILADIMAKSVALSYYESNIAKSFDRIEPMAEELRRRGRSARKTRELLSHIGDTLLIQSKMIGRVEIEDKPDLLWDRPDLERIYVQLANEYDLGERLAILKNKLELINQTAETLLGLVHERRSFHLEWYIVLLILFEIVMSLYEKFFS